MNTDCIPITIGILTYNSEKTLRRCLGSLQGVCEILIADGGSTDGTLAIAQEFGCTVISQTNPGNPIEDFSKERNHMLDHATYDWFFYLDADEIATPELLEDFRNITMQEMPEYMVYSVPYDIISKDLATVYKQYKRNRQCRLFNKKTGARFIKPMHEKIVFDSTIYPIGSIDGGWLVPLDDQLDFSVYKRKVHFRVGLMAKQFRTRSVTRFIRAAFMYPLSTILKTLYKALYVRLKYPMETPIPFRYELYRIYMQLFIIKSITKRYMLLLSRRIHE